MSFKLRAPLTRFLHMNCSRRSFIGDKIMSFANQRVEQTKEKQFQQMLEVLTTNEDWSLRSWKLAIEKQLSSWLLYIPGLNNANEISKVKGMKDLLNHMTEDELGNHELVNGVSRERIARASGQPIENVSQLIFYFKQSRVLSTWLKMKKSNNEPMPKNEMEMTQMQEQDARIRAIAQSIMMPKGKKKTGRGKGMPY